MSRNLPTEASFLQDVSRHQMTIIVDAPPHRHLHFGVPGSMHQHFRLVTFADYLVYAGDMGDFTFRRCTDMFTFFRRRDGHGLSFDARYWAEKVEASDRDGVKAYSREAFREAVESYLSNHDEVTPELRAAIDEEVLRHADDGEHAAWQAIHDFKFGKFRFVDFEYDLRAYTYRFTWAGYAIGWGIARYDVLKSTIEGLSGAGTHRAAVA